MAELQGTGRDLRGFQYESAAHETATALIGMWLFLATEVLFFGALFFVYALYRLQYPAGFALAVRQTEAAIGTVNTALLVTSSFTFTLGLRAIGFNDARGLQRACLGTMTLGLGFLVLKGIEYGIDFKEHLFPGPGFALTGPRGKGAELFFIFYFTATALHAVHMLIGIGLVGYVFRRARGGDFSAGHHVAAEVVGLYWSFVDLVWLFLFPLLYLIGRAG